MAKQKLRLTLAGSTMQAPIWPKDDILWEGAKIGCPYCAELRKTKPLVDVIQYGLIDRDMVITVFECRGCKKQFGVKYVIPHGHEYEETGAQN